MDQTSQVWVRVALGAGPHVPIGPEPLVLGRGTGCPLAGELARFTNVSRAHAVLAWAAGSLVISDLGSMNGTFVNGVRVDPALPVPVGAGDEVLLGTDCLLVLD